MGKNICRIALSALILVAAGCASKTSSEKVVEKKIETTKAPGPGDLASLGHDAFLNAPGLTEAQKIKLSQIMKDTYGEATKVKTEIGKAKLVLFETITSPDYRQKDVDVLKKKIVQLDKKRMDLMFASLDEVQKVIGRNPETAEYLRKIMRDHMNLGEGAY
jgi:hypothetical protein